MKKIINGIKAFFMGIWHIIDKFIVVPITKLVFIINNKLTKSGKKFETWIAKPSTLLFISLFFAIVMFVVVDQKIIFYSESSAEVLSGQAVTAVYNSEAYVIEGLPETVDIVLIGNKTDLYIAKQSVVGNVVVDLTRFTGTIEGVTKDVTIEYNRGLSAVEYKVNPSTVSVTIYKKDSLATTMTPEILNADHLNDTVSIENVEIDDDNVIIKGARKYIKDVAVVKALVDVDNLPSQQAGTQTIENVPLKAYDKDGKVVDVELVPATTSVKVTTGEYKKQVPIKVIPNGNIAFGLAISTIELSEKEVWIYGSQNELQNISYIPVNVDVNQLSENKTYKMELTKPVGVKSMSINNVNVTINIDSIESKDIDEVTINGINVGEGLKATASSREDGNITVTVKGVKSVIENFSKDDIIAYVDLAGLGVGTHNVQVQIEKSDVKVDYVPKKTTVSIQITKK